MTIDELYDKKIEELRKQGASYSEFITSDDEKAIEVFVDIYTKETYVYNTKGVEKFSEEINVDGSISTTHRWEYNT